MFGGMAKSVLSAAKAQMSQEHPITEQVKMTYDELVVAFPEAPESEIPLMKVQAAQATEMVLLTHAGMLVEGVSSGPKKVTELEVRRKVIEDVRDIKLTALEYDGYVNPLDLAQIVMRAKSFKAKAQGYLTNLCMKQGSNKVDSEVLDQVENRLLEEVKTTHGQDYDTYMRASQGVVAVIADLRLQRMAAPRVP